MNALPPAPESPLQKPDWHDFRDHIATADASGRRKWVFPRKPQGRFYERRKFLSWAILAALFIGPFVKINGNPLLMINVVTRRFSVLGHIFWPQDMALVAIALLLYFTSIMIFTAAYGRLWCGWLCPQTVLMEMVFRRIEYKIEGDSRQQRALAQAPWTPRKIAVKSLKHAVFFGLSFVFGNLFLSYIIGVDQLTAIVTDNPARHLEGLGFLLAFTAVFYLVFARFREQACTFICPYGRLQSTVLDENTIVVAYDHKRGEQRAVINRRQSLSQRRQAGLGDCVSCNLCVAVCPTGIDIRNGIQMECIHCSACIDACDAVMQKIGQPRGLVRYASLDGIERGKALRVTPRLAGYASLLTILVLAFLLMVFTRSDVQANLLRAPGALFQQMPDGRFSNLYTLKLVNKTSRDLPVELRLEEANGSLQVMSGESVVPAQKIYETSILIELDKASMKPGLTPVHVGVYSGGKCVQTIVTSFIGPR